MTFEQFQSTIKNTLGNYLYDSSSSEITFHEMHKLSKAYTGMTVTSSTSHISPVIDMNDAYDKYRQGRSIEDICLYICHILETSCPVIDTEIFNDYSKIKNKLFLRLTSAEKTYINKEDIPYRMFSDLMITFHIYLGTNQDTVMTVMITAEMLDIYNVDTDTLYQDALKSMCDNFPPVICDMNTYMSEMFDLPEEADLSDITVVSNTGNMYGASALLYPGMLKKLAAYEEGDFLVLPSSVHEVIVLKDTDAGRYDTLKDMVRSINKTAVSHSDQLSEYVYHYDTEKHLFETTDAYLNRLSKQV